MTSVTEHGRGFWVAFVISLLAFGLAFPAAIALFMLSYAFGFGQGTSPLWLLLAYALLVGFLFLVRKTDQRPIPRGLFLGCLVGSLLFASFIFLVKAGIVHSRSTTRRVEPVALVIAGWPNMALQRTRR